MWEILKKEFQIAAQKHMVSCFSCFYWVQFMQISLNKVFFVVNSCRFCKSDEFTRDVQGFYNIIRQGMNYLKCCCHAYSYVFECIKF